MTEEKEETCPVELPEGYYWVTEGKIKEGDLFHWRDHSCDWLPSGDIGSPVESPFDDLFYARPMHGYHDVEPSKARTDDSGKPPLAKVPLALTEAVANVMEYGHKKYGDYNNYKKGMEISRNLSCALRHIMAFQNGEDNDPESEQNHLGHAAARLGFVLDNIKRGTAIDDR